ncbi:hypothetical protein Pla108_41040 [Botrimarina colliarenosi]|uniref:DUF6677 domain-containing protein n=1 Tax=Botrimarina colliarenosi TaxID=2528001 RepID=A0A5C5ZZV5_9BACT|nr:DUF6677 family protein [Botrimarina colliarenosi]TWT92478.1 hypothetical protein Pla108_41040 [Botrimarina colliarenosi]
MAESTEPTPIHLPNPKLAALLAWLFPGLGHLYQGRRAKGVLFMASIVGLFVAGMVIGGGKVAYASTLPLSPVPGYVYDGWPFICQSGIGVVAIPGWIERSRYLEGEGPLAIPALYPPPTGERAARAPEAELSSIDQSGATVRHPDGPAKRRYDLGFRFEVGMVYTVIAGLLNLLVVYDAHSGPMLTDPEKPEEEDAPTDS